jgi:hypothetical protein
MDAAKRTFVLCSVHHAGPEMDGRPRQKDDLDDLTAAADAAVVRCATADTMRLLPRQGGVRASVERVPGLFLFRHRDVRRFAEARAARREWTGSVRRRVR